MNSQYLKIGLLFFCLWISACSPKASSTDAVDIKLIHTIPLEFDTFYIGFNSGSDMYYYKGEIDGKFVLAVNGEVMPETRSASKFGNVTLVKNAFAFFYGESGNQYLRVNKDTYGPYSGVVDGPPPLHPGKFGSISVFEANGNVIFDKSGKHFCFIAQDQSNGWILVKDGKKENLSDVTKSTKPKERKRSSQGNEMEVYSVEHVLNVDKIFPEGLNDIYGEAIGMIFNEGKYRMIPKNVDMVYPPNYFTKDKFNAVKVAGSSLSVNGYGPPQFSSGCPKFFEVIYNDQRVANYEHQQQTNPVRHLMLSKDGKHYAYILIKVTGLINTRRVCQVVVDGHSGPEYDYIGSMRFEENAFHYLGSKGRDIYTIKHRLD